MDKYILASASPRRKEILANVGISFEVIASKCEEVITELVPDKMVMELAGLKSDDVKARVINNTYDEYDEVYIIGADTMVFHNGKHMGKPVDDNDAYDMINRIQGDTHQVITGVCVNCLKTNRRIVFAETTEVNVVPMTEQEIWEYIHKNDSKDKAGAYGIQGPFSQYVSSINGDYYNVVGFPISRFCSEIKKL